jgi:uncharacterized protein (TIGR02147 family)
MIFHYSDAKSYLKSYLKQLPKEGFGEAKKIAQHLNVSSTYMSQVLAGQKPLTLEHATSLGRYLGLGGVELDYFFYLVQLERAGTQELKAYCQEKLEELKRTSLKIANRVQTQRTLNEEQKSVFYSSPLYSSIHLYCATDVKGRSLEEISQRFEVSRFKTSEMMRFLVQTGICIEENNRFLTGNQSTHLEQGSPHLLKHHTNWRLRAIQAGEDLNEKELMYTVNVALSKNDFQFLREEMVGFIQDFLKKANPSASEEIACLNMDWFWIRK